MKKDQEKKTIHPKGEIKFQWEAPEFFQYYRDAGWYIKGGIFIIIVVIVAFLLKNYLMAVVFLLIGVVTYLFSKKTPRNVVFSILEGGIEVDGIFYDYLELDFFWIFYNNPPEDAYVSIKRKKRYLPLLQLPIGEADPSLIRGFLLEKIVEKKHQEEFSNILEKYFKL